MTQPDAAAPQHASAVRLPTGGVLLRGPSGSGKSRLALQLIDAHQGQLVADDRVVLHAHDGQLHAKPATELKGLIEVRGLGLVRMAHRASTAIDLVVDLVPAADQPRLPEPAYYTAGALTLPLLRLAGDDPRTAATIAVALATLGRTGFAEDGIYTWPEDA